VRSIPLKYNFRNLLIRKLSTGLTFSVVTLVVLVLSVLLAFAEGMRVSLAVSGAAHNIIVIKPGATAESTSILLHDEANRVPQTPGVAIGPDGELLVSREVSVQTSIPRIGTDAMANVAVRGVDPAAFAVHSQVRLIEGRRFETGLLEAIVGRAARDRYQNLQVGQKIVLGKLANREYTIVGVFEAGGGALESEIWAGRESVADSYDRPQLSSLALRLEDESRVEAAIAYIRGPAVRLAAKCETDYYRDLTKKTTEIAILAAVLVGIMAVGAVFAVANTMYAAVDNRRREIAMLRTLGFSRSSIMTAFLIESLMICTAGCVAGIALSLLLHGRREDYLSDTTWTVLAFEMRMTGWVIGPAIGVSVLVGVLGSILPAWRAARVDLLEALRKA